MSKTKKILALALGAAMTLSLLAGCGEKPSTSGSNPGNPSNPKLHRQQQRRRDRPRLLAELQA